MQSSLYQKYRPIQFSDMVGQENVVKALSKASETNQFTHAYLFGGQHGSGKTSAARVLASTLTCPTPKESYTPAIPGGPCGSCDVCKAIHDGHCVDVYEMDGADKRKIEDVRKVIETCHYPPQQLARKIYILDEVHALTGDAASALLKTIEEPPSYVTFILCTTDIRKIKPTILSRCQRLHFNKILSKDIAKRLLAVAAKEGFTVEDSAALAIARASNGSMRDAFSDLERIALAESKNITHDAAMSHLGVADHRIIYDIVKMVAEDNAPKALGDVDSLIKASVDAKVILYEICEVFRNMAIMGKCGRDSDLLDLMEDEKDVIEQVLNKLTLHKAMFIAAKIAGLGKDFSSNIHERLILEAAVIQSLRYARGEILTNTHSKQP